VTAAHPHGWSLDALGYLLIILGLLYAGVVTLTREHRRNRRCNEPLGIHTCRRKYGHDGAHHAPYLNRDGKPRITTWTNGHVWNPPDDVRFALDGDVVDPRRSEGANA
jgi:hypothetical protein